MSPILLRFVFVVIAFAVAVVDPATATVPSYDPTLSMDALQYSKAVKCPADLVANWTCGGPCNYHSSVTDVFVYDNATWNTQGFSGYDAASNRIVIAFRGSVTTLNWIEDFDFVLIDYPNKACSPDCKIHQGFHTAFDSLAQQVASDLKVLLNKHPNAELLLVTGHSLGGAIAHLAALAISQAYPSLPMPLYLYTFGQPRVGNPAYAAWGSSLVRKTGGDKGIIYRMTHHQDPVPKLPPEWVGYLHSPIEVHYYDDTATNYRVCDDSTTQEDPKCCMGEFSLNGKDHNLYLGISADCN